MYFADKNSEPNRCSQGQIVFQWSGYVQNLQGRASLQSAMKWLHDKLEALNVPCPNEIYMNAQSFNGVVFAKYYFSFTRDVAIPGPSHSDSCKKNVLIRSTLAAWWVGICDTRNWNRWKLHEDGYCGHNNRSNFSPPKWSESGVDGLIKLIKPKLFYKSKVEAEASGKSKSKDAGAAARTASWGARQCAVRVQDKKFHPHQQFSCKTNQFSIFL